jgi:uncharacterized protein (TIGR02145 family)
MNKMENIRKTTGLFSLILLLALSVSCQNFFWSHTGGTIPDPPDISCVEYGYLYNWYAVDDSRELTSSDTWYIPLYSEVLALETYLGGATVSGGKIKETGFTYWNEPNTGATNEVGFNARGSGKRSGTGVFSSLKTGFGIGCGDLSGSLWRVRGMANNTGTNASGVGDNKDAGWSIRLVSDATGVADGTTTVYEGTDGKIYMAVAINQLYWLTENLAETLYRNGDPIPTVEDNTTWANLTTGAKCAYDNNYSYVGCDEEFSCIRVTQLAYNNDSLDLSTQIAATSPRGISFSNDGSKMYIGDIAPDSIYQFTLSTAWDITTATYDNKSFYFYRNFDIQFNNDGTKMYLLNQTYEIFEYALSSAWDISTASVLDTTSGFLNALFFQFSPDGERMWTNNSTSDYLLQWDLSVAWDVSTATYNGVSEPNSSEDGFMYASIFSYNCGDVLWLFGDAYDKIYEYSVNTAFDITDMIYTGNTFDLSIFNTRSRAADINLAEDRIYFLGLDNGILYQLDIER